MIAVSAAPSAGLLKMPFRKRFGLVLLSLPWLALLGGLAFLSRFLNDDAFISFRYARNLLEGNGLTWNPGEYVEGYTNFLWVLELAAIWAAAGVPPEDAVWGLSAACTVAVLGAMAWWVRRLPGLRDRGLVWWMALGLVCSSATFATWTSGGGLETRQFTLFVVTAAALLTTRGESRRGLLAASSCLALASLTRPEGLLVAACCIGWWVAQGAARGGRESRRFAVDRRGLLRLAAPAALAAAGHFLWRRGYYGEWLPNTFYAKYTGPRVEDGLRYLAAAGVETGLYLLLPLAAWALWARWRARRDLAYGLPFAIVGSHMAYLARIGGDPFGWRLIDFWWPLLAVPAADGIARAGTGLARLWRRGSEGVSPRAAAPVVVACFGFVLLYAGALQGALFREYLDVPPSQFVTLDDGNAGWALAAPGMPALAALSNDLRGALGEVYRANGRVHGLRRYKDLLARWGPYQEMERGFLPDDAVAAAPQAGVRPYFLPDLVFVDVWGLTDATVARNPDLRPARYLAHERQPPPGYLRERVNFDVGPAASSAAHAVGRHPYAAEFAPGLWMPFDAPSPAWVEARFDAFVARGDFVAAGDLAAFVEDDEPLLIASRFNVYDVARRGRRLLAYVRTPCDGRDLRARFFLHLEPADEDGLPEPRKRHGFDNLDFRFTDWGLRQGARCVAMRPLPGWRIAAVRTGQFTGRGVVWREEFRFPEAE